VSAEALPVSLSGLADAYRAKDISPVEAVEILLGRISAVDGELNTFITVLPERATEDARRAESEIMAGKYRGPLHGVPIALKDVIYTGYSRTTMGSAFFEDYVPGYSATVVSKLEEAGAIVIGKTNTHEFAYGATGDRSHFGPTRNPHDPSRVSGGSSSGSAAAVAAGLCYGALGSDTAGSVRIPSALCGVTGMKPTFGRVSKKGVFPLSWSLDHVGPITRTVEDNAILLQAISGSDLQDPYSANQPTEDFTRHFERGVRGKTIGVPEDFYFEHVESQVEHRVRKAVEVFHSLGARIRTVELPCMGEALKAQRFIFAAESYAVHRDRLESAPEKFDEEVREYLLAGERLKAYRLAIFQRNKLHALEQFKKVLADVDVLLTPTVPVMAPEIGQREVEIGDYREHVDASLTRLTGPTNLTGLPSLSISCGVGTSGLPVGLQIIGSSFDEATIYRYGHAYEKVLSSEVQE
jgi:aspartyl-tRNA(Asn)/glutamyl-tRNA(Gln) amidotransferase subunit A